MKWSFFLIALALLLVGCTSTTQEPDAQETIATQEPEEVLMQDDTNTPEDTSASSADETIIISSGKLSPESITIPVGQETTIVFDNEEAEMRRIDIPMYQSEVSADIAPGTYEVVTVHPKVKGQYFIELNGARLGTIVAE